MSFGAAMRVLVAVSLLVLSANSRLVDHPGNEAQRRQFSLLPNLIGCEQTKACYADLLLSIGYDSDSFPDYDDYQQRMTEQYSSGKGLATYCGSFDAVSRCFSAESDSCRAPTVFATLFNLTNDDAYRYATDLDLRKILCDNQQELADPCLNKIAALPQSLPVSEDDQALCEVISTELITRVNDADDSGCSDSVKSLSCQISTKTREIAALGACDGQLPACPTDFHSCDWMHSCFNKFYDGVEKAGVVSPLPDYTAYASAMKRKFENAAGIDELCRLQENLDACLVSHVDRNCPLNVDSFRSMFGMNYEQAYDYSTDYSLRKTQCLNKEGVKQNTCVTKAKLLTDICHPEIPHNLTLGKSCTDLRLAMRCNNAAIRESCPEEAALMYCQTTEIIYQQEALGFCDGWMPGCDLDSEREIPSSSKPKTTLNKLTGLPNFVGCEQSKACYSDLLQFAGFDAGQFPSYDDYQQILSEQFSSGEGLAAFCGTFDAVAHCFSQESDSCRTPTVFATLLNLTSDDAYRFAADLDLRRIMCDSQQDLADPCLTSALQRSLPAANADEDTCHIDHADVTLCSDSAKTLSCQIESETKEIETLGACDGKMPKCASDFHSCEWMQGCFNDFYDGVEKAGVKSPLPDYTAFASAMKKKFENAAGIDNLCRLQESLDACLVVHVDRNCPLNAASFRSMFNMNYEQAYNYATDYSLRKTQCLNKEGVKQNLCVTKAKLLTDVCHPEIPHDLSLGKACIDLRLAMKCNNFAVRQFCPEAAQKMYCETTGIVYQQEALGFCDGWMPSCEQEPEQITTQEPETTALPTTTTPFKPIPVRPKLPNMVGCEQTKACYVDLLQSVGFDADPFPSYDEYQQKLSDECGIGPGLASFCGSFDAVSRCFSQESDSCRTPTVFTTIFNLTSDDAFRYAADLDLRKIMCDNQLDMADPCFNQANVTKQSLAVSNDADDSCLIDHADVTLCPDSVKSLSCQIESKTKEIDTLGACDGKLPKCATDFHSCDWMQGCFNDFYNGIEKAGVKSPLPDYTTYATNMKRKFENPAGIDDLCRLQENLDACLIVHMDKHCPINAASFRSMFNMNYEQAYDYSTDYNLRKTQCLNKEGVKQNACLTPAKVLLNVCHPEIPHNLTLGQSCTDLRLAMRCNNAAVREFCPYEAAQMYCQTTEIIYEQEALGFCDGWMPGCDLDSERAVPSSIKPKSTLNKLTGLPNMIGCEQSKACYADLLQFVGFDGDSFPSYDDYQQQLADYHSIGEGLSMFCGAFDAVSRCFSQESDSCRTPTIFTTLFNLTSDEAYRYAADLDLRKIMCDNQLDLADACLNITFARRSLVVSNGADDSCLIEHADVTQCPESVKSLSCQIESKTKEIETVGACDGKMPKCATDFHSCDWMQGCFNDFYSGVEKAGVKSPLPDYSAYATNMKRKFENANGIDDQCRLQENLDACLIVHMDKHCPLNAASFRSVFNMNYEQAYNYATDYSLRKSQCMNKEGVKQNVCVTKAKILTDVCHPEIPHNLTLGKSCTDLRLAMKCNNFAIRQFCPAEAQKMYCETTEIVYQQEALGFCDGWMPGCEPEPTQRPQTLPTDGTDKPYVTSTPEASWTTESPDIKSTIEIIKTTDAPQVTSTVETVHTTEQPPVKTTQGDDVHTTTELPPVETTRLLIFTTEQPPVQTTENDGVHTTEQTPDQSTRNDAPDVTTEQAPVKTTQHEEPPRTTVELVYSSTQEQPVETIPTTAKTVPALTTTVVLPVTTTALPTETTANGVRTSTMSNIVTSKPHRPQLPNMIGCDQTKACFADLMQSVGFDADAFPSYDEYQERMSVQYGSGSALSLYCGSFDAVSRCFSQESDSCRTPTVFTTLFNLTNDDAYRFTADLDLRKIMCDNQSAMDDPCLNGAVAVKTIVEAAVSCDVTSADDSGCSDSVKPLFCQLASKTKEIETLGSCDGKIAKCQTNFHSCDWMQGCFDTFYAGVEKAGVKSPLPDYASYASAMKRRFENAAGINDLCGLQESLEACLVRRIDRNCPLNAASFRSMYNMNYEQAYNYATDYNLRTTQCLNKEGVKQNTCLTPAKILLNVCQPDIPHDLSLGKACTDLRLAMKCNNFAVRQFCPQEAAQMYCQTTEIIYQQEALGFCDGWMPGCDVEEEPTHRPPATTTSTTDAPPPVTSVTSLAPVSITTTTLKTVPTTTMLVTETTTTLFERKSTTHAPTTGTTASVPTTSSSSLVTIPTSTVSIPPPTISDDLTSLPASTAEPTTSLASTQLSLAAVLIITMFVFSM